MYRLIDDFICDWQLESESTLEVMRNISDNVLHKKEFENVRSIARLCWHFTITISEMINKTGINVNGPDEHSMPPEGISEIIEAYKTSSASLVDAVKSSWQDIDLIVEQNMYGEIWKNGKTLSVLITHQAHHRGQLIVLMRQAGLRVPGIYGPAKEDWAEYGKPSAE